MIAFVRPPPGTAPEVVRALAAAGFVPVDAVPPSPWTVCRDVDEIRLASTSLWLRGLEAAGAVGRASALVGIRAAAATGRPWVAEGLSARGMAAAMAVGAAGIVIDAPLWLARESPLPETVKAALRSTSSGHDTTLSGELEGTPDRSVRRGDVAFAAAQNVADARPWDGRPMVEIARAVLRDVGERRARMTPWPGQPLSVVQGPMANVAEGTGLARAVSAAGAMPFAALGALDPRQAADLLRDWAETVPRPWGVGVIGFDVMPFRDAHLAAIDALGDRGPAVVTLAGASPALAMDLVRRGRCPWLHTPSGRLAEQALAAGVPGVILEGHEAGGHVGKLTSVGLWEDGLAAAERFQARAPDRPPPTVVLAGGIGDVTSAAFAAAMAADAASRGIRVVLQAGTAFLLTHEAAEHGQVTPIYQARALAARTTVLVGSTVNLPLRCVPNTFTDEARTRELAWEAEAVPKGERRRRLEHHNLGRTRIAAKGIERDPDRASGSRYRPVAVLRQDREGAFTVGQGATATERLSTVAEVVRALSTDAVDRLAGTRRKARWGAVAPVSGRPASEPTRLRQATTREGDVAIVGLGCVLPGALDIPSFFRNLVEGVDAVGPIPAERWDAARYVGEEASRSYTRHAGVIRGFRFDPVPFRIPPKVVATMDPSQRIALAAAAQAVAGLQRVDRKRAAVVLGNAMGGEYSKSLAVRIRFRDVIDAVARDELLGGFSVEDLAALEARVEERIAVRLPPIEFDSMAGLLSNVVAGRVASWLDWMGGNLTVDAACAASLAAVSIAVDWLRMGRCDVVLAGGVDTDLSPESFVGFCRTQALSLGASSPFSTRADGFAMGEGAAVVALKRLADAERDGDRIWAVIRGIGSSSDGRGRGITAPRAEGQALAIDRAYAEAGLAPSDLGMVEAHGTGTTVGDATEVAVLRRIFAHAPTPTWLGSVKSMIGHLKSAAGAASLLKTVLALQSGVIPPTVRAGPLQPELRPEGTPFRLPRSPTPFPEGRRKASVSAFGFGGTNYHLILESHGERSPAPVARGLTAPAEVAAWRSDDSTPLLLAYGAETSEALLADVAADRPTSPALAAVALHRAVILAEPANRAQIVARAARWLQTLPAPGSALGREAFVGAGPAEPVVVAFPGQGSQQLGAVDRVCRIPAGARALADVEDQVRALTGDPRALRDRECDGEAAASDPLALHAVLYAVGLGWSAVLRSAGVPFAATIGHSLGAFAALVSAGSTDDLLATVLARGKALADCPEGAMLAVRLDETRSREVGSRHGLVVAAVNGAERTVLAGPVDAVRAAAAELGAALARPVNVQRAYHSPSVAPAASAVRDALSAVRFASPIGVWSARTASPVEDPAEDLVAGVVEPVRFEPAVRALIAAQHRVWVEAGPGTTLSRIVEGAGGIAVPLDPGDGGLSAAAALLALGHPGLATSLPATRLEIGLEAVGSRSTSPSPPVERDIPVVVAEPSGDPVRDGVLAVICEVTGYPPELVLEGSDLEADLGVDSIRKMEILGLLEHRFGFTSAESDYSALATADLGVLVAHVRGRTAAPVAEVRRDPVDVAFSVPIRRPSGAPPLAPTIHVAAGRAPVDVVRELASSPLPEALVAILPDDAGGAAAAGWLRSAARELGRPLTLWGHDDDGQLAIVPLPSDPLPERPVVLATGGARGILLPCLRALDDPRVVLLSRGDPPEDLDLVHVRGDVTVLADVAAAATAARERWGRIDVVLHAAGVLHDGPIGAVADVDRDRVVAVKVQGARNLVDATLADAPALFCAFSSVVARIGNAAQTTYGAANAALETVVHPTARRSVAIGWTAWSGVGMAADPRLQALLASRGVRSLTPVLGAAAFRRIVDGSGSGTVHVTLGDLPDAMHVRWPLGPPDAIGSAPRAFPVPLDPESAPLCDHRVGRRALVPAALWLAAVLEAARVVTGRAGAWLVEGMEILAPTFVDRPRTDVRIALTESGGGWSAEIRTASAVVCRARVAACADPADHTPPIPLVDAEPAGALYRPDLLFHGPAWQVLRRMRTDNGTAEADLLVDPGPSAVATAVDGVHQVLAAWSGQSVGWLGLPVGADRWIASAPADGVLRIETRATTTARELRADVVARDTLGRVVLWGEGIRLRAASRGAADA